MWRSLLVGLVLCGLVCAQDRKKEKPAEIKLSDDEKGLFDLMNKARAKEKLPALKLNAVLCRVARRHSANMAKQEKMSHVLDGKGVAHRVTTAGYDYRVVRENLAVAEVEGQTETPPSPPADIHKGWMESKGHRANILDQRVIEVGISMVKSKKGNYYYTQVFAVPRK